MNPFTVVVHILVIFFLPNTPTFGCNLWNICIVTKKLKKIIKILHAFFTIPTSASFHLKRAIILPLFSKNSNICIILIVMMICMFDKLLLEKLFLIFSQTYCVYFRFLSLKLPLLFFQDLVLWIGFDFRRYPHFTLNNKRLWLLGILLPVLEFLTFGFSWFIFTNFVPRW